MSRATPVRSSLTYYVYDPVGNQLQGYGVAYNGYGQSQPVTLATNGNYRVRVRYSYDFQGEYRLRVTLAPAGVQAEYDYSTGTANDTTSNANVVALSNVQVGGVTHQQATVLGALTTGDGGDFYRLGNLTAGTAISLSQSQPSTSGLSAVLAIYQGNTQVAVSSAGASGFSYTIPSGGDGTYSVRVTASSGAGLQAQYILGIDVVDTVAPTISGVTIGNGASSVALTDGLNSTGVLDRIGVSFSEDLAAATVNNPDNIDLREAGPDATFDTPDDILYHVASPGYSAGLSATYRVTDGPLQPGSYRLTIGTGLTDKSGNPMESPFVRSFGVDGIDLYRLENRDNDTFGDGHAPSDGRKPLQRLVHQRALPRRRGQHLGRRHRRPQRRRQTRPRRLQQRRQLTLRLPRSWRRRLRPHRLQRRQQPHRPPHRRPRRRRQARYPRRQRRLEQPLHPLGQRRRLLPHHPHHTPRGRPSLRRRRRPQRRQPARPHRPQLQLGQRRHLPPRHRSPRLQPHGHLRRQRQPRRRRRRRLR